MKRLVTSMTRFGLLAAASFALNVGLTVLLHELLGAPEELAFAVGLIAVFAMNFFGLRHLVFDAAAGDPARQLLRFLVSSIAFRVAEYLAFLVAHSVAGAHYVVAIVAILAASTLAKFFFYRSAVFNDPGVTGR